MAITVRLSLTETGMSEAQLDIMGIGTEASRVHEASHTGGDVATEVRVSLTLRRPHQACV